MKFDTICLVIMAAVSFFLLCANVFLVLRHSSTKKKQDEEKKKTSLLLSTTAHDLRSPLTSIKGFADAMLDGTANDSKKEEYLALISSEAERLARLSSRLCEGEDMRISPRVFGLCDIVRRAYLLVEQKTFLRDIKVDFSFDDEDEFYVRADIDAVFEIVLNLFENAVKYCSDKGQIFWSILSDGSSVILTVKNTTDFLPEIPDIFAAGARGESKKTQGFGLGLYISQKLANQSGTELVFDKGRDENGYFCEFSIKLNAAEDI